MIRPPGQNAMPPPVDIRAYWTTATVAGSCQGCISMQLKIDAAGHLIDESVMLVQVGNDVVPGLPQLSTSPPSIPRH